MVEILTEKKFVILLFLISVFLRLMISPFYVDPPDIPHDFPIYIATANTILDGKTLYTDVVTGIGTPTPYGPFFALLIALWIKLFGNNYVLLKIPMILADSLSVIVVYYIVKNIKSTKEAELAGILYSVSYFSILSSAALGNDDHLFLLFMLISLYFLVKQNFKLFSFFIAISMGFKFIPLIIFLPPAIYYMYKTSGMKNCVSCISLIVVILALINLPFYLKAGNNIFIQIEYGKNHPIFGLSLISTISMLVNYFTIELSKNLEPSPVMNEIATLLSAIGYTFIIFYIYKFQMLDKKIELIRNVFLFIITTFFFSRAMYDSLFIWIVPFAVMIFALYTNNNYINRKFFIGTFIIIAGILIHSIIYRWAVDYSTMQRTMLFLSIVGITYGTYLSLPSFKMPWSYTLFSIALARNTHAKLLLLFGFLIPALQVPKMAWGYYIFVNNIIFLSAMVLLFYSIHKASGDYAKETIK